MAPSASMCACRGGYLGEPPSPGEAGWLENFEREMAAHDEQVRRDLAEQDRDIARATAIDDVPDDSTVWVRPVASLAHGAYLANLSPRTELAWGAFADAVADRAAARPITPRRPDS